jgi:hypothetical protein
MKKLHAVAVIAFLTASVSFLPGISSDAAISSRAVPSKSNSSAKAQALKALSESEEQLAQLDKIHEKTVRLFEKLSSLSSELAQKAGEVGKIAGQNNGRSSKQSIGENNGQRSGQSSEQSLIQATKEMQETQMSFNLQYLQLQSQMQTENRSYTAVSNIMKTKHDTMKNTIANIR